SLADTRRPRLARRILALDSASAVAHEERALAAFLEFDWRRGLAETTGDWQPEADGGMSGAANRALRRTHAHLERALRTEPRRASAHRLRLRARAAVGDDAGLLLAARQYHAARPESADASLFLGLARFRTGDVAGADAAFRAALERMGPPARAAFSDLTLLLDRDGRDAYAADSAAVAAGFWEGRDPRLLTDQNERWLEHAARLALADLLFSDPRTGRRGWESTRGEMAVRYGLPLTQRQWMSARDGRFVAWDYGDFQLLFEDTFVTGEAELWSSYEGADMVTFARSLANRMPERADYRPPSRVTFPFAAYAFRGGEGRTDLYVRYGVPVAEAAGRAGLRSGAFLLADGRVVAATRAEAARFRPGALRTYEGGTLWTDGLALQAAPGSYELAVEFEQDGSGSVGFERVAVELPAFPAGGLAVSDVVLAYGVEEAEPGAGQGSALVRRGLSIDPAPWGVFGTAQPVYVYVEVYGLTPAADGRTRYAVEATLRPQDTSTGLARLARSLFGRRERGVAVADEADGTAPDAGAYVAL
ncbi:MAG: GWxTD domain-containing protein, partial [Rhodothermales bacterium]|nr:GWxTD domain-containing protein [Rhodothermales bacterium]